MNILFCGDVMPGGVLPYQRQYITDDFMSYIKSFDFRVATLEAAIGTNLSYDDTKIKGRQNIVYARDADFFRVKDMHFDVVSLANNHVWDLGEEGLKNTIETLKKNNILFCGAGLDLSEASAPAILEKDGLSIAIFAYCMYGTGYLGHVEIAGEKKAGVNPLDIEKVESDIREAKKKYNVVIVMPHWGMEYSYEPLPECISLAKRMVDAGADAILGSHTHQVQPLINIHGTPVCFSMGNFLFPDFYMQPPRPIWYPDSTSELSHIRRVYSYPFPIEEHILQVWNPTSRIGRYVITDITKNKLRACSGYVELSHDNILGKVNAPFAVRYQLCKTSLIIKYPLLRALINAFRWVRNQLK